MIKWRTIPEFPLYELNREGEVRNIETGKFKKAAISSTGLKFYSLHWKGTNISKSRSMQTLLFEVFGIEKKLNRKVKKPAPTAKNCNQCNWYTEGKCSVKNPGTTCSVDSDDSCLKWERIRGTSIEYHSDNYSECSSFESSYENTMTRLIDHDSMLNG